MEPRACDCCGNIYQPVSGNQRVCRNNTCRRWIRTDARREWQSAYRARQRQAIKNPGWQDPKPCIHCGELFTPNSYRQTTCKSRPCLNALERARHARNMRTYRAKLADAGVSPPSKLRVCEACGAEYTPRGPIQRQCGDPICRRWLHTQRMRAHRIESAGPKSAPEKMVRPVVAFAAKPAAAPKEPAGLPCERCEHWKPMAGTELGGYCAIGRFTVCKPYLPGVKPFKAKEA